MIYIAKSSPGTFAYIDEGKHIKNSSISGITDATGNGFIDADTECTGIRDCDFDIAAPCAVTGTDTVRSAGIIGETFSVIQKIVGQFVCDSYEITKKIRPPRVGWSLPSS